MAESAGAAAVPEPLLRGLPDEISIWEILVRLPPKVILRCRAVCRDWRRATSSSDFLLAHHARQPTLPLLGGYADDSRGIIHFDHRTGIATADQLQSVARIDLDFFDMVASCDGLLVLSIDYARYSICNPATRQYALLPMLREFRLMGMYRHSPTGEFRLLLKKRRYLIHDVHACHVFTIGSGQPPRRIGCPDLEEMMLCIRVPVLLHDSMHWYKGQTILVFDTTVESFRQIPSPIDFDNTGMFEIDGMLGMCSLTVEATIMDIWVMQDCEGEAWAFKHRVELPVAQLTVQFGEFSKGLIVAVPSGDGDVLVLVNFGDWILQIDTDGKLVASFHNRGLCLSEVRFKQTLVPHGFFPALEGYVVNASPFIRQLLSEVMILNGLTVSILMICTSIV